MEFEFKFKHLGVDANERANSHEEINRTVENKCYLSLIPLFEPKLLTERNKVD